jgi:DNA-binding response OmpR family regulator
MAKSWRFERSGSVAELDEAAASTTAAALVLTSGESIRVEGVEERSVVAVVSAFDDAGLSWSRVGSAREVGQRLVREARASVPDLLIVIACGEQRAAIPRSRENYANVPILALGAAPTELESLEAGADAFCALPVDGALLRARARALLRRQSGTFLAASSCEGIELDASSRILRAAGTSVQLSPREYDLIERLHQCCDSWVSRDKLLEALALRHSGYDSSLLRMHTLNIRKKLRQQRWVLQSARGKGLMLTSDRAYATLSHR